MEKKIEVSVQKAILKTLTANDIALYIINDN